MILQKGRLVGSSGHVRLRYAMRRHMGGRNDRAGHDYTDIDEARAAAERLAEERG